MNQPIASYAVETNDADQTRALGEDLGRVLAAGDLVMLSGGLGAGKTTLTQGIGVGMGVRGRVASPTFIVARVHPNLGGGPDLIHADAYRITDLNDLENMDDGTRVIVLHAHGHRWDGVLEDIVAAHGGTRIDQDAPEGDESATDE